MDLFSLIKQTEGIEDSIQFAIQHCLLPSKSPHTCIKCGKEGSLKCTRNNRVVNLPYMFVCSERTCRATVAIGRNTLFDQLKFPLSQGIRLIYFWLLKIPVNETSDQLQLLETTVVEWFKIFMEVCAFIIINYTSPIGGPGHFVELIEHQLVATEGSKVWLLTGVDRCFGNNFAISVKDIDCQAIWPILKNYILPGTTVVTKNAHIFKVIESTQSLKDQLNFVLPKSSPRMSIHYHLDLLFTALEKFIDMEMPPSQLSHKELYAYKFLYFNRDGVCNLPASKLFTHFLGDVKLAYPGLRKFK